MAAEVAKRAGVNWIVTGKILRLEPNYVLTSQIEHAVTGEIRNTQSVQGEAGEDLFNVIDKLTTEIRMDLSLPEEAGEEPDQSVADITTHSIEAYRYYLEGMDYLNKGYGTEAQASFEKSLENDSTFAMAYLRLASADIPTTSKEKKKMIEKALHYSERSNKKEKMYIESYHAELIGDESGALKGYQSIVNAYPDETEAYYSLGRLHFYCGNVEPALENLTRVIEINPLDKRAYAALAHFYQTLGDIEKSIWAINELISIAPDEADPYDTRGYLYAYRGNVNKAIESFKESVKRDPEFGSLSGLGHMYLFKEEYENAEKCYRQEVASENEYRRAWGRLHLASIPLYQGKLNEALVNLDRVISEDQLDGFEGYPHVWKLNLRSLVHLEKKNREQALSDARRFIDACNKIAAVEDVYYDDPIAMLLARNKEISEAERYLNSLKDKIQDSSAEKMSWYWLASGWLEMEKSNIDAACVHFEKANEFHKGFIFRYSLALAYLKANRLGEAVQVLEQALKIYDATRAFYAIYAVKAYYCLGLAYEKSGSARKAAEQYQIFLDIWKNADPDLEALNDAREHLSRLKGT
ncbi:MAG: hypothetical protein AMJ88_18155 [Anaerolineae bacterium SM23_ 63]|nr:MAG: hypothetical protein AMJ88_18155 [Anaerolineae bacterium SM23_ 63]